ncbi:MAG: hypothetical protein K0U98_08690 [Deltaproteobacteria bacterium]|nr:hypothetical protein [Deltaproteobacteria bacterium]
MFSKKYCSKVRPQGTGEKRRQLVRGSLILIALAAVWVSPEGQARDPKRAKEVVEIHFLNSGPKEPAIQPVSGWPLTLELRLDKEKLKGFGPLGVSSLPSLEKRGEAFMGHPQKHTGAVTVGEGSDGSNTSVLRVGPFHPPPVVVFRPGLTVPQKGVHGARPQVFVFSEESRSQELAPIGPPVGSKGDGYGYGHNRRLPGLVLIADGGPGVVTGKRFNRPKPLRARNLAGFFQSISYQLKDAQGQTTLMAHMNVPPRLFSPVVLADCRLSKPCELTREAIELRKNGGARREPLPHSLRNLGGRASARKGTRFLPRTGNVLLRVDGGPLRCEQHFLGIGLRRPAEVVTLRAFLVHGTAPARLQDLDGDGVVSRKDAVAAGLRVLSQEAIYRVRIVSVGSLPFDFSGDKEVICPDGGNLFAGELTPVPR